MASDSTAAPRPRRRYVQICQHRSCLRGGSDQVLACFHEHRGPRLLVVGSDCLGQCSSGPTVKVMPDNVWYCQVTPEDVPDIVESHLQRQQPLQRLLHPRFHPPHPSAGSL